MTAQAILPILQLILTFGNICILGYALFKFLTKPHDTLETKVNEHEDKLKDIDCTLAHNDVKIKEQEVTNEVMQSCMLALIDFELAYCIHTNYVDTEDLTRAKMELRKHLASK